MISPYHATNRRGTVLILVLGLITLFMALLLSATIRVYNAGKSMETMKRSVNAYMAMQAAKIYLASGGPTPVTLHTTMTSNKVQWSHINGTDVIAAGGSTGGFAAGKSSIFATDPARSVIEGQLANAFEIRYHYTITAGVVELKSVDDNTVYPW